MKFISPRDLHEKRQPSTRLIDVRTPAEYAEVHVPGAELIPLDRFDPEQLAQDGLKKDEALYILCRSGKRAEQAAEQLSRAGFENPWVVEGGTLAWAESGLPVNRGTATVISLERQVRIAAGALVLSGVLLGYFVHWAFLGLSAFVGAGLVFAGITDWCGMGLLLARMPWNQRA